MKRIQIFKPANSNHQEFENFEDQVLVTMTPEQIAFYDLIKKARDDAIAEAASEVMSKFEENDEAKAAKEEAEREEAERKAEAEAEAKRNPFAPDDLVIELVKEDDLETFKFSMPGRDKDTRDGCQRVLDKLNECRDRKLAKWPDSAQSELDRLSVAFPNMIEVIDLMTELACLSSRGNHLFSIPPILLSGPPGIGKTEFAEQVAEVVGTAVCKINMASVQSDFLLAGSDKRYGNTQIGEVADFLVFQKIANPIFLLDELDKAADVESYNPTKSLLQLLEKRTAKEFRDQSVPELRIDTSNIIWIALANDIRRIPGPVLSRFRHFEIKNPDAEQAKEIARSIYKKFKKEHTWGETFADDIDDEVIENLASLNNPRVMRQALESAFGKAAKDNRDRLIKDDVKVVKNTARRIGF